MSTPEPQDALVHLMVSMAAADGAISPRELRELGEILRTLPVFVGFDVRRLDTIAGQCSAILDQPDGIDRIIANVRDGVPEKLHETAYALAVEVASADIQATQPELRFLQMLRDELGLDRLVTGAIEHSARVRYRRL